MKNEGKLVWMIEKDCQQVAYYVKWLDSSDVLNKCLSSSRWQVITWRGRSLRARRWVWSVSLRWIRSLLRWLIIGGWNVWWSSTTTRIRSLSLWRARWIVTCCSRCSYGWETSISRWWSWWWTIIGCRCSLSLTKWWWNVWSTRSRVVSGTSNSAWTNANSWWKITSNSSSRLCSNSLLTSLLIRCLIEIGIVGKKSGCWITIELVPPNTN